MNLKQYIAEIPNFPKEGINFKDISPLLANAEALEYVTNEFIQNLQNVDKIVGLDAR